MNADDIKFIQSEAESVKKTGYATHSKLPPKAANALIVETLASTVILSEPRSTYVNILMEKGKSRRVAYQLVSAAYAKKTAAEKPSVPVPSPIHMPSHVPAPTPSPAPSAIPPTTSAPSAVVWPGVVRRAANSMEAHSLESLVTGAWTAGVTVTEHHIERDTYTPTMLQIEKNAVAHAGVFAHPIIRHAFQCGMMGDEVPLNQPAKIFKSDNVKCADLAGVSASVFIAQELTLSNSWGDARKEIDKKIDATTTDGDEYAMFIPSTGQRNAWAGTTPSKLSEAVELARYSNSMTVIIHKEGAET